MAKKKKIDGKEIAGRIITIFFVLLLIAGAYYLFTLFKDVPITSANLAGTWKVGSSPVTYYTFEMDENHSDTLGRCTSYTMREGSPDKENNKRYTYELVLNEHDIWELHMYELNERNKVTGEEEIIKVTKLSTAQMYVIIGKNEMTAMVKDNLL